MKCFCRGFLLVTLCLTAETAMRGQAIAASRNDVLPANPLPVATSDSGSPAWQPLTGSQRLLLFWDDTYNSPGAFLGLSISALTAQITNTPAVWSTDGNGYTRRFASSYGQLAARNIVHEGLAGATGLDPRYIPCNCRGAAKRTRHALKMTFTTYSRTGRTTLDVPQIAGAYGSGMVSTYWYPHRSYSPLVQGLQFGHEEMGEVFLGNIVQEFGSDLERALHLKHSPAFKQ